MGEIASASQLRLSFARWAIVTVPLVVLLGLASSRLSGSSMDNGWFAALAKPAFMPPGWAFPVAWTLLYAFMGLALALVLHARGAAGRGPAILAFCVQFVCSLAWSPLFFVLHKVTAAFWLILAIFALAALTAWLFSRIRAAAGLLLLPYLAWLLLASALNFEIDRLNPDAETLAPEGSTTQIAL